MNNLHVIIGEDDYLVDEAAKKIIGDGVGLEVIDSANSTNAELQLADLKEADASFSTPPFLDPQRITWWKNVNFLPGSSKRQASEEVKLALEKFAEKLVSEPIPSNQHFILSGPKMLKTSIFAKKLAAAAEIISFEKEKSSWKAAQAATVRVVDLANEVGLKFAPGAAEAFVSRVGTDSRSLMSELAKMRDFLCGKDMVTTADIQEVTSQGVGVEPEVWSITDALGERNLEKVVAAVKRFEAENGFAVLVTTVVEKFFRQLVDLATAAAKGDFDAATAGMAPFAVRKMKGFLSNWTLSELRIARWRFLTLREKVVSSSGSSDVLVLTEMVRVCRRARAR